MHFTRYYDRDIDNWIRNQLLKVCTELRAILPVRIHSIVVYGAFGRGEGRVVKHKGKIDIINDIDLMVITDDAGASDMRNLQMAHKEIFDKLRKRGMGYIDMKFISRDHLPHLEFSMDNYDLKYGGVVIWGNPDVLKDIPLYDGASMPWVQGRRLLLNRLISFLESRSLTNDNLSETEASFCLYQCSKVFFACIDAYLIEKGQYTTRYIDKVETYCNLNPGEKLTKLAEKSLDIKTGMGPFPINDAIDFWNEVGEAFVETIVRYFKGMIEFQRAISGKGLLKDFQVHTYPLKRMLKRLLHRPIYSRRQYIETIELLLLFSIFSNGAKSQEYLQIAGLNLQRYAKDYHVRIVSTDKCSQETVRAEVLKLWYDAFHFGEETYEQWANKGFSSDSK